MKQNIDISIKDLLSIQDKLKRELRWLLYLYDDYRDYFKGKTPDEAESRYYMEKYLESGYDSEGLFSLNFSGSTLKCEIKNNRKERNKISQDLKDIKNQIKEKHRYENNRNISKK
ncbi:MAG: hypothetical protein SLAVMIC_00005 [uncultured marine phage]|uniref:Uncharacterized protein n=1 Tax=uncultured marine phage TaxID=707152 RepID=A0A8D9CDC7_9VIRU|nr:MAG: hypothetical protein SLAVMIC_00005 [uncultured marine phage]